MRRSNTANTSMETNITLRKESYEELVDNILYKQIIESMRFLCNIRPNICHSMGLVSRFMEKPRLSHLLVTNRILRYISDTTCHGFFIPHQQSTTTEARVYDYSDSD